MSQIRSLRTLQLGLAILLAALCAGIAQAADDHEVTAFYKVADSTDLGTEVRVTLQIRFVNNGDQSLTITKASLQSLWPPSGKAENDLSVILPPHKSAQATCQFVVSPNELAEWKTGMRPRLLLRLQNQDGKEITRSVVLTPGQTAPMGVE
jgi:hypothetical protein